MTKLRISKAATNNSLLHVAEKIAHVFGLEPRHTTAGWWAAYIVLEVDDNGMVTSVGISAHLPYNSVLLPASKFRKVFANVL